MNSNISSTTLQSWRERPPSSYSIKVKIFSQLQISDDKYQSRLFSSGGYNWRMIIYPQGNEKDNGNGFISIYVEIDRTSLISTQPAEVFADLRFFVFNKKENKYFTIQDVESKPFNTLRTMWGLSQVVTLDTFNDHKNGYIFDGDHCEFGVDIIVVPPLTKWEVLKLYLKGWVTEDNKWLSIFLYLAETETLKEDEKIYVQANLKLKDPRGSNHWTYKVNNWFLPQTPGYGWDEYVAVAELRKTYLDNEDTLKVEIEFEVVSAIKYSSST